MCTASMTMEELIIKEKLTIIETFSGIGAQVEGLKNTGLFDVEVVATSEIDKDAILSYAAIHNGLTNEMVEEYSQYPSREEMTQFLTDKNIGYDFKKNEPYDWKRHINSKKKFIEKHYLACILQNNLGDISRIEKLPYADMLTYSFPCTDISVAGKQEGLSKGGKTRSGLLWEVERLLKVAYENNTLPKYLLLENVKNLVGKKFKHEFDEWLTVLDDLGYNTYWEVINGKDCGVPQNRERVFGLSIRKDIDTGKFTFPVPFDNGIRLKDVLEDEVDEKYYISQDKVDKLLENINNKINTDAQVIGTCRPKNDLSFGTRDRMYNENCNSPTLTSTMHKDAPKVMRFGELNLSQDGVVVNPNGISPTHTAGHGNCPKIVLENRVQQIGNIVDTGNWDNPQRGRIYSDEGCSPALNCCGGGGLEPKILQVPGAIRGRYSSNGKVEQQLEFNGTENVNALTTVQKDSVIVEDVQVLRSERTGYGKQIRKQYESGEIKESRHNMTELTPRKDGISNTLTTVQKDNYLYEPKNVRIRKLTPTECWILMGFKKEQVDKCIDIGLSNSQLYKQAGNSIITKCIELLGEHLYKAQIDNTYTCFDERVINFMKPQEN